MRTDEPQVFLQYQGSGEIYSVPFPPFYIKDNEAFFEFCQDNGQSGLHFERDDDGRVRLMRPSGSETGRVNGYILTRLSLWNETMGEPGYVFDSSAGFRLPNGAVRAPDVSYIVKERYDALSLQEREHHAPLAPDFVVEVMSPSDRLTETQAKLEEYVANGVRLGWLIDRRNRTIWVYRADQSTEMLVSPGEVSASPELSGFRLVLERVF